MRDYHNWHNMFYKKPHRQNTKCLSMDTRTTTQHTMRQLTDTAAQQNENGNENQNENERGERSNDDADVRAIDHLMHARHVVRG